MTTFASEPSYLARCTGCGAWAVTPVCVHCGPLYATVEEAA